MKELKGSLSILASFTSKMGRNYQSQLTSGEWEIVPSIVMCDFAIEVTVIHTAAYTLVISFIAADGAESERGRSRWRSNSSQVRRCCFGQLC